MVESVQISYDPTNYLTRNSENVSYRADPTMGGSEYRLTADQIQVCPTVRQQTRTVIT